MVVNVLAEKEKRFVNRILVSIVEMLVSLDFSIVEKIVETGCTTDFEEKAKDFRVHLACFDSYSGRL